VRRPCHSPERSQPPRKPSIQALPALDPPLSHTQNVSSLDPAQPSFTPHAMAAHISTAARGPKESPQPRSLGLVHGRGTGYASPSAAACDSYARAYRWTVRCSGSRACGSIHATAHSAPHNHEASGQHIHGRGRVWRVQRVLTRHPLRCTRHLWGCALATVAPLLPCPSNRVKSKPSIGGSSAGRGVTLGVTSKPQRKMPFFCSDLDACCDASSGTIF
jgi:hypothetical protein